MKVFVQLIDEGGRLVAQHDRLLAPAPAAGDADSRTESYGILVPHDLPAGVYDVIGGLYRPDAGAERVLTVDGADHVSLGAVTVADCTIADVVQVDTTDDD